MKHPCLGSICRKYLQCLQFSSLFWSLHEVALFSENNSNTFSIIRQSTMLHLKTTALDDRMAIANIVGNKKISKFEFRNKWSKRKTDPAGHLWNWLQLWIWRLVRRRKISILADWFYCALGRLYRRAKTSQTSSIPYFSASNAFHHETNTQGRPQSAWKSNWCCKSQEKRI